MDSHSSGTNVAVCLKQPTRSQRGSRHMETYLVLLRVGFTLPLLLPVARCALTAPFHPYLYSRTNHRRSSLCCTGRGLSPPRCYLALYPLEPGLSSVRHPFKRKRLIEKSTQRLSSQLAARIAQLGVSEVFKSFGVPQLNNSMCQMYFGEACLHP